MTRRARTAPGSNGHKGHALAFRLSAADLLALKKVQEISGASGVSDAIRVAIRFFVEHDGVRPARRKRRPLPEAPVLPCSSGAPGALCLPTPARLP